MERQLIKTISSVIFSQMLLVSSIVADAPQTAVAPVLPKTVQPLPVNGTVGLTNNSAFDQALESLKDPSEEDTLAFYQKMGREPVWFSQGNLTKCGQIAAHTLKHAAEDGLNPQDYEDATNLTHQPSNWIEAELLLTKRYLEYITHVRTGRIDPSKISRDIKFHSPKTHPIELLVDAIHDKPSNCKKLQEMAPSFPQYKQLKETLANLRVLAKEYKDWPMLKASKPLKMGDKGPDVAILQEILILQGDLATDEPTSLIFDNDLEQALRQFQKRHTIEPDGIVGGKTKEALNEPIKDQIHKVVLNMERLRWLPDELGDKYIIVNVAGYEVQAFENQELKLTIPAIVGRPSRRTPLFYASLKNVIVNPSWGVPYNILVHDKIPKIINDPYYVRRSGFTVTDDSGNVVDPDQADWENEGTRYHLRQSPGRHNALGRIKFNIENPYTIYMHGTPEEKLFQKTARPFSSGCVRLKTPVELAVWVLNNEEKWSSDDVTHAINKGGTQTVKPDDDIKVFFTYQTVWVGEDGLVHISDDPYRMDPKMAKVLDLEA